MRSSSDGRLLSEVIDAIAFSSRPERSVHLPEKDGNRLRMWAVGGTWERVFSALMAQADADGTWPGAAAVAGHQPSTAGLPGSGPTRPVAGR